MPLVCVRSPRRGLYKTMEKKTLKAQLEREETQDVFHKNGEFHMIVWLLNLCDNLTRPWSANMFTLTLLWVSVKMFLGGINIYVGRLSKLYCFPWCQWSSFNHLKDWIEYKLTLPGTRENFSCFTSFKLGHDLFQNKKERIWRFLL